MNTLNNLEDLLIEELRDLYNAEHQLLSNLPGLARKTTSETLRSAIESHLEETSGQVRRLETISRELGVPLTGKRCRAMEGLVEEAQEVLNENGYSAIIDEAIISALQRIEHYEMAAYGNARALAEHLHRARLALFLQESLDEEKAADLKLTDISEHEVLVMASAEGAAAGR